MQKLHSWLRMTALLAPAILGAGSFAQGAETRSVPPPGFSVPGGFYTNSFELSLSVTDPQAVIHYTLDGSEPTENSTIYRMPLTIQSRAGSPKVVSAIPTASGWRPPAGEVFKGTPVRARAFKAGLAPSRIETRTFWITPRGNQRYPVPVISLNTMASNFFDAKTGIYVLGNSPNGNFMQHGPQWERPVHIEFYETNGTLAFAQAGTVKIHGNTSQNFPIKGLDLAAAPGSKSFHHRIFPDLARTEFKHVLLRPSGHDWNLAFMRDEMMLSISQDLGAETQASRLAVVFLNGEYWGLHYLKEKQDTQFVTTHGGVTGKNIDYLEGFAEARAGDTRNFQAMMSFLNSSDLSRSENYDRLRAMMDVPNYTDYKIAEIFNYRWDIGNHRLWRSREPGGRWRWLPYDNDVGWGGFFAVPPAWEFDMVAYDLEAKGAWSRYPLNNHNDPQSTLLLRKLITNESFRWDFLNRFADLLNTTYMPEQTIGRVDRFAAALRPEMPEHIQRWQAPASVSEWERQVQMLREFARLRPDFVRQHLIRAFQLSGTVKLRLALSDPRRASIKLNTIQAAGTSDSPWQGIYFEGIPLTLTAVAQEGFRFKAWQGATNSTSPKITLSLTGDTTLTAVIEAN